MLHFEIYKLSILSNINLEKCCLEWFEKSNDKDAHHLRVIANYLAEKAPEVPYPTEFNPNVQPTLERFKTVQMNTQCLFAANSRLWSHPEWIESLSFEDNVRNIVPILTKFMLIARYENLDGFVWEFPDSTNSFGQTPEQLGQTMRRLLTVLSEADPSGEDVMQHLQDRVSSSWQFKFNYERIFVTSFAPCYPDNSPRYAFGSESAWILFQPEFSFSFHQVNPFKQPGGVRQKIRDNYRDAGRPFHVPKRNELMGHLYVRPADELGGGHIDWWL